MKILTTRKSTQWYYTTKRLIRGTFFWDYSGIGILGIDGYCILLGHIPFSEWTECYSVHFAPNNRMNRIRFTHNRQNVWFFGGYNFGGKSCAAGHPRQPGFEKLEWTIQNVGIIYIWCEFSRANVHSIVVHGQFPALSGVNNRRPTFQLPPKSYIWVAKIKQTVSLTNPCMRASFRQRPALHKAVSSTSNSLSSSFKRFLENDAKRKSK